MSTTGYTPPPRIAALIVAAGRGERVGTPAEGPKQYRLLGGEAMIRRTLRTFREHPAVTTIEIVIHPDDEDLCAEALGRDAESVRISHGGATRQESVRKGLESLAATAPDIVLIQDAARPFASPAVIDRTLAAIASGTGALPTVPLTDTVKEAAGRQVVKTLDRSRLYAAQTPQGFRFEEILAAHRRAAAADSQTFTDDASIAEWDGLAVRLVEGDPANVKITTAQDLAQARARFGDAPMIDVRTGNGYDVHRLVDGDHVTLCGVRIPHDRALDGHSDADVGLHALTDALLATCGAGDIGDHFPPSDPQWRGAPSRIFVEKAVAVVAAAGGRICNADISLICEAPKIAPHREAMRAAIAEMTGLSLERVSVKATTNETIGFVGRREGIAAIATASVVYGESRS
ncbi:bifunctional 2-C-methyl-D-erythritol 4-phosphate cytidylyltransferase/2-C-methyl-D-erythritol 2,4-cyclodiphosphate synthase [Antarcticirhabdus aurantiaca]|uniref:Bifunctional 2-C-methyl-D-erythritol 4-phosphate cytidylyltransferase/2-C-methyl-D-erythritol 2,4-cyclodiphosphate synthase n=1 Tax=Antarcticirhabdus aurantiaca TaxID=2606717 RepID=A0ACD4NVT5_9HYPH|nr:bifunctional 2-C-methyl-D-erythritol 4-phosphate cytidylyltransferase/2-C-methyl-D-erythritol 2,4-cyclodiphosphate synthase [Antarcticirhabdus aurantiaca]WAJ30906.1 bifunctional 2-C-methyl-D-erythritol 4-phosphate cytidylyltransferase/2-C-methyl-D-erythritol 2,4-cyclodiphosphate synthase [Jeongeuplla avenae]